MHNLLNKNMQQNGNNSQSQWPDISARLLIKNFSSIRGGSFEAGKALGQ
jgi:hypothetical protein